MLSSNDLDWIGFAFITGVDYQQKYELWAFFKEMISPFIRNACHITSVI